MAALALRNGRGDLGEGLLELVSSSPRRVGPAPRRALALGQRFREEAAQGDDASI